MSDTTAALLMKH
jgi:hypothetical protein